MAPTDLEVIVLVLSRLLTTLSILAAVVGLSSLYVQNTAFAPEHTRDAVATVLDDPAARSIVASQLASAASLVVPNEVLAQLPPDALSAAANSAAADPTLLASAADAVVAFHEAAIGEPGPAAPVLDGSAAAAALASALRPMSAAAADVVSANPIVVELPVREVPGLAGVNYLTGLIAVPLIVVAALLGVAAFAISPERRRVLRRLGIALLVTTVLQVIIFWAAPRFLLPALGSDFAALLGRVISSLGAGVIAYLITVILVGVGLIAASVLWPERRSTPANPVGPSSDQFRQPGQGAYPQPSQPGWSEAPTRRVQP